MNICIQINENGWRHLKETVGDDYIKQRIETKKVQIENETWYKLQCYVVFEMLSVNFGGEPMFNTNVMFDSESLS